ncbi:MAG: EF-hand domain-containing protein [Pseudomonadota bacterium]
MKTSAHTIVFALLTGFSALAMAQATEIPARGPMPFAAFDSDYNGVITEQEFMQTHAKRQTLREAQGRRNRVLPDAQMFHGFDTDGDGVLNQAELSAGQTSQQQGRVGMQHPGLPTGESRGLNRGRNMPKFTDFDMDQNGLMTEDEFIEGRGKRISERAKQGYMMRGLQHARPFAEIDADGDGLVNPEEFAAAQAQHMQQQQNLQDQ